MELILIIAVVVIAVLAYRSYRRTQLQTRKQHEITAAELESVKRTADEDITRFGEELQDLDLEMVGKDLGDGARQDYQRALDAYESAKQAVGQVTQADQIKHVIEILEDGRYAATCVRARVNGEPLPQRRPSCFFNPQHGPSVEDVSWAPPGGAPRDVPACAADAERVRAGAEPDVRKVMVGPQRVPYWEAGPAYSPYAQGMFRRPRRCDDRYVPRAPCWAACSPAAGTATTRPATRTGCPTAAATEAVTPVVTAAATSNPFDGGDSAGTSAETSEQPTGPR